MDERTFESWITTRFATRSLDISSYRVSTKYSTSQHGKHYGIVSFYHVLSVHFFNIYNYNPIQVPTFSFNGQWSPAMTSTFIEPVPQHHTQTNGTLDYSFSKSSSLTESNDFGMYITI